MRMSRRAKRMDRHHRRNKGEATINLVSMIDMLTVLVLFLLVNSANVQNLPSTKSLKLPESSAQKIPKETIIIMVNNEDIVAQGRKVATVADVIASPNDVIPALLEELKYQAERSGRLQQSAEIEPGEVTIMGDRKIPYVVLKKIMVTCTKADYTNISLAVSQKASQG